MIAVSKTIRDVGEIHAEAKKSVSSFMGYLKGKSVMMIFENRHFCSTGYFVNGVSFECIDVFSGMWSVSNSHLLVSGVRIFISDINKKAPVFD